MDFLNFLKNFVDYADIVKEVYKDESKTEREKEIEIAKQFALRDGVTLCGECKHWKTEDNIIGACDLRYLPTLYIGYCNFGEKTKEHENENSNEFTKEEKELAKILKDMGFDIVFYDNGNDCFYLKSYKNKIGFYVSDCLFPTMIKIGYKKFPLLNLVEDIK